MNDQQYQLITDKGPEPGKVYDLTSVSMTIGRDPMSEITINDPEVSRRHARLIGTLSGYRIQDLGSTNGTFVDGVRLSGEPLDLESGQIISIGGGVALVYREVDDTIDQSVTMLDTDIAFPESDFSEDQSEIAADESIDKAIFASTLSDGNDSELVDAKIDSVTEDDVDQETSVEPPPPDPAWETLQQEETQVPDALPTDTFEAAGFTDPVVIPHKGESAKPLQTDQKSNYRRLSTMIAAVVLLIICCCCSVSLFLYYYGGDWLLRQMGLLP